MFVPREVITWFTALRQDADSNAEVAKQALSNLSEELAAVRADRDALKLQLSTAQNHFDWLRVRVNVLEVERAQLVEKAYGIRVPVPEVVRTPVVGPDFNSDIFSDIGDTVAKQFGLPTYDS